MRSSRVGASYRWALGPPGLALARARCGPLNFVPGQPGTNSFCVVSCLSTGCVDSPSPGPSCRFVPGQPAVARPNTRAWAARSPLQSSGCRFCHRIGVRHRHGGRTGFRSRRTPNSQLWLQISSWNRGPTYGGCSCTTLERRWGGGVAPSREVQAAACPHLLPVVTSCLTVATRRQERPPGGEGTGPVSRRR
jgi:hypothetical protein